MHCTMNIKFADSSMFIYGTLYMVIVPKGLDAVQWDVFGQLQTNLRNLSYVNEYVCTSNAS